MALPNHLRQRAAAIKLLVLDVDGVLTDGALYFGSEGEVLKRFHVRDGAGIVQLRRAGIQIAIISGRTAAAVTVRMAELGVQHVHQGVHDKGRVLTELLAALGLTPAEVACVGDDTPDLAMFAIAGVAIAVADAHPQVRAAAHWVTEVGGGQGAVREVCDALATARSESDPA